MRKLIVVLSITALMGIALPAGAEEEINYCFGEQVTIEAGFRETVVGTSGPDVIHGGYVIDGRGGDDLICSLNGPDKVYGGEGDDKIDGGDNQDTIEGGPGDDYLTTLSNYYAGVAGGDKVSYERASGPVSVDLSQGIATGEGTDTLSGFREIIGSDYDDILRADAERHDNGVYIDGRGGDDVIHGSNANVEYREVLLGGGGSDTIHAYRGWDLLVGAEGNDNLFGNRGTDDLQGGLGDDNMDGGRGSDSVRYGEVYVFGDGSFPGAQAAIRANFVTGTVDGEGKDTFSNFESLEGTSFDDVLLGDGGPNSLGGGAGDDILRGWRGDDFLSDGPGTDEMYGGRGSDFLGLKDGVGGDIFDGGNLGVDECRADPEDIIANCER
ncbi:MAG: calcium-binding protein [Actinomycetota bacterium]